MTAPLTFLTCARLTPPYLQARPALRIQMQSPGHGALIAATPRPFRRLLLVVASGVVRLIGHTVS